MPSAPASHALVGHHRAAFEENDGRPESNPFAVRAVRLYLCEEEVVDSSLEFLILASDGLWDVVTNELPHLILSKLRLTHCMVLEASSLQWVYAMQCVEAAATEKHITLKPGEEWTGKLELSAVPSCYYSGQLDPDRVLQESSVPEESIS